MERMTRGRTIWAILLVMMIMAFFCVRLYTMQIVDAEQKGQNITKYETRTRVRATRGDLVDTNGNVLVTNRASYDLVFNHYVILNCGNPNERLLELVLSGELENEKSALLAIACQAFSNSIK